MTKEKPKTGQVWVMHEDVLAEKSRHGRSAAFWHMARK